MKSDLAHLIDALAKEHALSLDEYERLVRERTPELAAYAAERAVTVRKAIYGNDVFVRGLIEISSFCKNDCLYCGIRSSNATAQRYRLSPQAITDCANEGYELGFRTFVLQGGEDPWFDDGRL